MSIFAPKAGGNYFTILDGIPGGLGTAGHDFYREAELKLAKSAKNWIRLKQMFKTRMHPAMLALLRILTALQIQPAAGSEVGSREDVSGLLAALAEPLPAGLGEDVIRISMKLGSQAGASI